MPYDKESSVSMGQSPNDPVQFELDTRSCGQSPFFIPCPVGMEFAYPTDAETNGTVLIHTYKLSGVRNGEDLSASRNSCSAR